MINQIKEEACLHGDRISFIAVSRLPEVKKDFEKPGFDYSPYFDFAPGPEAGWTVRSVITAASPTRRYSVSFDVDGREFKAIIPASYTDDEEKNNEIIKYLYAMLRKEGFHVLQGKMLPMKALAVHTGLGSYGRNNLVYIDGFGSFLTLNIFFTDLAAEDEPFLPFSIMDACKGCNACVKNCPSGALREEPFCIDAARCLTGMNEHDGDFPEWVEPSWHNALVGCESCQLVCPRNRDLLEPVEEISRYNRKETEAFLRNELPYEALEPMGIAPYHLNLARNLKCLLEAQGKNH